MRCLICCWLQVYGSDREGAGRGLRKNMGMADHRAGTGLRKKKMGIAGRAYIFFFFSVGGLWRVLFFYFFWFWF